MLKLEVSSDKRFYSTSTTCSEILKVVLLAIIRKFLIIRLHWKKKSMFYSLADGDIIVSS